MIAPVGNIYYIQYNNIMIRIIYSIASEEKGQELEWLRDQKIFPAAEDAWDWKANKPIVKIGVIVSPESALAIKLRHKLEIQTDYRQR